MKQQSKLKGALFLAGGLLMVVGAGCFAFMYGRGVACWIYLVGAVLFASMQMGETYEGANATIRRLKRIMTVADIFFVIAGLLMVDTAYQFARDAFADYMTYIEIVYNKWVLVLLVAALLEMYTMHRMSSLLDKEDRAHNAGETKPQDGDM